MNPDAIAEFQMRKAALKEQFLVVLKERVSNIEECIREFSITGSVETLKRCKYDFHKTAGVAGAFGMKDLGAQAQSISRRLDDINGSRAADGSDWCASLLADMTEFLKIAKSQLT